MQNLDLEQMQRTSWKRRTELYCFAGANISKELWEWSLTWARRNGISRSQLLEALLRRFREVHGDTVLD